MYFIEDCRILHGMGLLLVDFGLKKIFKFLIDVQKLFGKCAKNWPPETRPVVGEVACPCTQCCIFSNPSPVNFLGLAWRILGICFVQNINFSIIDFPGLANTVPKGPHWGYGGKAARLVTAS